MDNRELLFSAGKTAAGKINKSFLGGISVSGLGSIQDVALIGFQAARAKRGGFVPAIIGQSTASVVGVPLAGFISAGLCLIPGVGPLTAAIVGNLLSGYAEARFGSTFTKKVRLFTDLNKRIRHLEMGGSYQDTESAATQRFLAVQDINAAMIPGRRYLGREALLMHR